MFLGVSREFSPSTVYEVADSQHLDNKTARLVRFGDLILVGTLITMVLFVLMRLWSFHPHIPVSYDGDGILTLAAFRNMQLHPGYMFSNLVGYPYGQHLQDFPAVGDAFCLSLSWLLVKILRDPVVAFNFFFLLTYPISGLGGYVGGRLLGLRRPTATVISILYAFIPFHGMHGAPHLFLIMYPVLPIVVAVMVREVSNAPGFPGFRHKGKIAREAAPVALVGLAGGVSGLYYAFFTLLIFAVGALMILLDSGKVLKAWRVLIGLGTAGIALALQFIPILWYQHQNGPNLNILKRGAFEVEYYSLRLIDLFLPIPQHPISRFATFTQKNVSNYIPGEATAYLGIIASMGVVLLLLALISHGRTWLQANGLTTLARLFVVLLLGSVLGGFNQLLASFGFTQIRVWSRISIVLAFLALAAFGIVFDHVTESLLVKRGTLVVSLALITIFGLWDTNRVIPAMAYSQLSAAWHNDSKLVGDIESHFGPGARILQLPILKFPEQGPIEKLGDYAQLRGELHSRTLCWSYGVVLGRDEGRTTQWQQLDLDGLLNAARQQGFDAVWLEMRAYPDNGTEIGSQLTNKLGDAVVFDQAGLVQVFDLRAGATGKRQRCH